MEVLSEENSPDLSSVDTTSMTDLATVNIGGAVGDLCEVAIGESVVPTVKEEGGMSNDSVCAIIKKEVDSEEPASENVLRLESGIADGYIILSREAAASLGMNSDTATVETDVTEPANKRFRFQGEDGQSYVLTVADSTNGENPDITLDDQHKNQATAAVQMEEQQLPLATAMASTVNVPLVTTTPSVSEQLLGQGNTGKKAPGNSDVTQAWFTTRFDKVAMQSKGASWKQGQWTKEEIDVLQCNIDAYCRERGISDPTEIIFGMSKDERKDFYRTVAKGLQRPLFSVYRRVTRMYDQKNHMGKYSPEEMAKLRELRCKYGNDWASIGSVLGRSASSVKDKCRLMRDTCNSGKWLPEEEHRLSAAVYELAGVKPGENVTSGLSWASVAERVLTRSEKQCRTKWLNFLNWKQKGGTEWTREDDINLVIKIANLGVSDDTEIDWTELAKNWPSVRSPQWLRGKWWSLKRHVPDYQLLSFSDLITFLKNVHLQNVRMKNPVTSSGMRLSHIGLPRQVTTADMTTLQIPMSLNSNLHSLPIQTGNLDTGSVDGDTAFQTFEVLHQTSSGTFLISQPQNSPVISLSGAAMGTDHIIVHTLPTTTIRGNENVTVQMNPTPVILSTGPSQDEVSEVVATLDASEMSSSIQLTDTITESDPDLQTLSQDGQLPGDEGEMPGSGLDSSDQLTSRGQIITSEEIFEAEETNIGSSTADTVDLVMVSTTSPSFVQTTSSELMSSLSDPMLPYGGSDLIGSSSDMEGEKSHGQICENDTDITSSDINGADS
ncbi:cyclin-D-binding Myb-like transcription factor 1 isoform X2 [Mizuhopecten yessoensis]|uniref:Cyclin-D-binding Myb-like transcription factor 1 n=1 Tax=Mizuhopecten yessoensis TaxID=6573 RepID=A0A210PZQ4_MIZYE|nr:cyclin-D-binding Myb-like transcription factor 1 isoform X2 [Mizuhopecten yessoensis]OWF41981.1 Cyclin-D-binding Myb-like transcription factor 1 [Mizuhopecten yessoensis]